MNIELRKVSHNQGLSEETNAYTAQVWVDGVHFCDVSNHGQGGPDMHYPAKGKTRADIDALNAKIKAEYPKQSYEAGGQTHTYDTDLEHVCGELLTNHLISRDLQRLLKRTVAFVDGKSIRSYTGKCDEARKQALIAITKQKHPNAVILNVLPFERALEVFKSNP